MKLELKYSLAILGIFAIFFVAFFIISWDLFSNNLRTEILDSFLYSLKIERYSIKDISKITEDYFIEEFTKENSGYYYVIDEKGYAILHTDPTKVGIHIVKDAKLDDLWKYMRENDAGTYEYIFEGEKRYVSFVKITSEGKTYYLAHAITYGELFADLIKTRYYILNIFIIFMVIFFIISYYLGKWLTLAIKKQVKSIEEFSANVASFIAENSAAAAEMESVTKNTQKNINELDELIQNFASAIEEGRSELNSILNNVKSFFLNIQDMTQMTMKIADFINNLSDLNYKIKDISETVSILSINSSIETSKEEIDREGISRIADMINELAYDAKKTSRESEKVLKNIESSITSSVLLSEKTLKELSNVENSLDSIDQVVESFVNNIDTLSSFSNSTKTLIKGVLDGIKQTFEALEEIKNNIDELVNMAKKIE
ncbi:hypothetical protein XO10_09970 [Marinitoga sp. 1135]|uniref:Methyl-accepting transducer domain-containing protein n=1 Tax=Marinitoga piezophila (strain DSM 14283 / JCM 11233 / KA3) TaxID=443254 RepID=H2J728_MARPK|nr:MULTISPECIES: methyl-accepting chemotaxis protein [Marinitoga]AEX86398.1 hypothetical protein Marpi_2022 [Marinitoga piezophila KA3]APT76789.1 hypothetical protein LN42_10690 [Marinitoga sp. 1137]NUU96559.1 hypothetical protein [Marinitoga sp. 1135]NUU98490.1 hypothetical protein [Marinitoga sp. 1138]